MTETRTLHGYGDAVVSPHHLSTAAGLEIFARGGSAADAAIAVDAVQGVVAPETCGVGGDLFALVWQPGDTAPACLNASGPAGSGGDPDELRAAGHDTIPVFHPMAVTIPGCVAGWEALHARFGRLDLGTVLEPAIRLAGQGFAASTELAHAFTKDEDRLSGQPACTGLYPGGRPPRRGDLLERHELASTLREVAGDGAAAFYGGRSGEAISQAVDGRITLDDLTAYSPEWVEAARLDVFGVTGWTVPPNSQGYLTLATMSIFESLGPPRPDDPLWTHLLIEAYRSVAWERNEMVADPVTAPLPWRELLSAERLGARAGAISPDRAGRWPAPGLAPGGTAYMCAVGADGMGVSLIQSNFMGIGSRIGAGDTGFLLHNRGAGFDLRPGHPNELTPGRRPLHTLSPTLWTEGERLRGVIGTRGGHQQPQLLAQVLSHLFSTGDDPGTAQDRPRWITDTFGPGEASVIEVEGGMDPSVVAGLEERGHEVRPAVSESGVWGPVSIITLDEVGMRSAASDPRVDTTLALVR